MGLFDFLRRAEPTPGPRNLELLAALRAEKTAPCAANRARLLAVLKQSVVLIAVRDLPPHLRNVEGVRLTQAVDLDQLGSTNAAGEKLGLIFTDHANVQARKEGAPWIAVDATKAAQWWKDAAGLVINPAGDWVELTRGELEQLGKE